MGGDINHTHLVKGLDYALLNQERQKLKSGSSDGGPQNAAAAAAAAAVAEATAAAQKQSVKFATPLGRSLYHAVFRTANANRNVVREMFQPRRTAFVFEFAEGSSDVPTTLRRSKADCPAVQVSQQGAGGLFPLLAKRVRQHLAAADWQGWVHRPKCLSVWCLCIIQAPGEMWHLPTLHCWCSLSAT